MLDLGRFVKTREVIVPIVESWGQYKGRKLYHKVDDYWYKISLPSGIIIKKASPLEILLTLESEKKIQVYALGTEGIPLSFESFRQKGLREAETIHFMNLPIFTVATAVLWEDGRLYFYEHIIPKERNLIEKSKEAFEGGQNLLDMRGITPELRYYVLLTSLQRQTYESLADFAKSVRFGNITSNVFDERLAELKRQFGTRLKFAVENAGGTYIRHSKRGNGFQVEWRIGNKSIKTHIRDDFRIISAGFCLSGDDKKHTINSIVGLAKLFQEESFLNIVRE